MNKKTEILDARLATELTNVTRQTGMTPVRRYVFDLIEEATQNGNGQIYIPLTIFIHDPYGDIDNAEQEFTSDDAAYFTSLGYRLTAKTQITAQEAEGRPIGTSVDYRTGNGPTYWRLSQLIWLQDDQA